MTGLLSVTKVSLSANFLSHSNLEIVHRYLFSLSDQTYEGLDGV